MYFYTMEPETPGKKDNQSVNEPSAEYQKSAAKKSIRFFNSFEEAEDYGRKQMAGHTHEQRLQNLEILRKRIYAEYLLPNGEWPPLSRTFKVIKATFLK